MDRVNEQNFQIEWIALTRPNVTDLSKRGRTGLIRVTSVSLICTSMFMCVYAHVSFARWGNVTFGGTQIKVKFSCEPRREGFHLSKLGFFFYKAFRTYIISALEEFFRVVCASEPLLRDNSPRNSKMERPRLWLIRQCRFWTPCCFAFLLHEVWCTGWSSYPTSAMSRSLQLVSVVSRCALFSIYRFTTTFRLVGVLNFCRRTSNWTAPLHQRLRAVSFAPYFSVLYTNNVTYWPLTNHR